jgi:hypothetical protein
LESVPEQDKIWYIGEDVPNFEYEVNFDDKTLDLHNIIDVEMLMPVELKLLSQNQFLIARIQAMERDKIATDDFDVEKFQKSVQKIKKLQESNNKVQKRSQVQQELIFKLKSELLHMKENIMEGKADVRFLTLQLTAIDQHRYGRVR